MNIAYFVNQYPHVSHTFIRREILELEKRGANIHRIALRGWDSELVDETDINERKKTTYILKRGLSYLLLSALKIFICSPIKFFRALYYSISMSNLSERSFFYHIIYLFEACCLSEYCLSHNIKHVHVHFGTNSADVAFLAKMISNINYSFTVHGPEEFDKPLNISLKEKIKSASFVVAITSFCRSQLFRWADLENWDKIKIVRCGLSSDFLNNNIFYTKNSNQKTLLCIGRLCEQKGQLLLLKSFSRLIYDGHDLKLILAGDGDMRKDLEAYAAKEGLLEHLEITGWVSSSQVKELLLQADAMVLPSFAEGLPVAIMEAMALKCPVITTYIAGIPELISNKVNGFLCPAGDVDLLVSSIDDFLSLSDVQLESLVDKAYQSVLLSHDIKKEAAVLEELFVEASE
jgi:glycosyltransferase involved in cell wall biosynthesis